MAIAAAHRFARGFVDQRICDLMAQSVVPYRITHSIEIACEINP